MYRTVQLLLLAAMPGLALSYYLLLYGLREDSLGY
jgi:hypothetical protein